MPGLQGGPRKTARKPKQDQETKRARDRKTRIQKKYGLAPLDYSRLLKAQNNCCAICQKPLRDTRICVDHDHETGLVRGLLCHPCNIGLGNFLDDIRLLSAAIVYLDQAKLARKKYFSVYFRSEDEDDDA